MQAYHSWWLQGRRCLWRRSRGAPRQWPPRAGSQTAGTAAPSPWDGNEMVVAVDGGGRGRGGGGGGSSGRGEGGGEW